MKHFLEEIGLATFSEGHVFRFLVTQYGFLPVGKRQLEQSSSMEGRPVKKSPRTEVWEFLAFSDLQFEVLG